jgi:hypothetical protein
MRLAGTLFVVQVFRLCRKNYTARHYLCWTQTSRSRDLGHQVDEGIVRHSHDRAVATFNDKVSTTHDLSAIESPSFICQRRHGKMSHPTSAGRFSIAYGLNQRDHEYALDSRSQQIFGIFALSEATSCRLFKNHRHKVLTPSLF